jgi:hypothetical protein
LIYSPPDLFNQDEAGALVFSFPFANILVDATRARWKKNGKSDNRMLHSDKAGWLRSAKRMIPGRLWVSSDARAHYGIPGIRAAA